MNCYFINIIKNTESGIKNRLKFQLLIVDIIDRFLVEEN